MEHIKKIAEKIGLKEEDLEYYGKYMAKIDEKDYKKKGKLILVSAMTPTTSGEGKTTISIGLSDALNLLGKKSILSLREPSLGPVFGLKGGATGGGKSRIEPSDEINLHFTGDIHAITSANNLLSAMIDNSIFQGNPLNINPEKIFFHRCLDMNDRSLREVEISLEDIKGQVPRRENFIISAASEIMALLCLATDFEDLKERLGNILVALSKDGNPIFAKDLQATDAMACLLTHAIKPNLVQTAEGNPCIVHGGPFANIAHGCSSVIATKTALSLGEYCVTEAGFGGDLGGEKFIDVVCRENNLAPAIVVIVATIKALKEHSQNGDLVEGYENLRKHIENFRDVFNCKVIVALNRFNGDSNEDIKLLNNLCDWDDVCFSPCSSFAKGGRGAIDLAEKVISFSKDKPKTLSFPYNLEDSIEEKIFKLATKIYGAKGIKLSDNAKEKISLFKDLAKGLPIVVAKTQYSLSDNQSLKGRPENFDISVDDVEVKTGSKFIVIKTGKINLMPGLNKTPNAINIKVDKNKNIFNLK